MSALSAMGAVGAVASDAPGPVLAVRLDSDGDVLLTGPAVAALATAADGTPREVDLVVSSAGRSAGALLPGVAQVRRFDAPWTGYRPPPLDSTVVHELLAWIAERGHSECVIFTSFHQSPLPMALLARMAGVPFVAGTSEDYPGSLLDVRHRRAGGADGSGGGHEVLAALDLVAATGRAVPPAPRLAVREDLTSRDALPPDLVRLTTAGPFVVVHPGASVPARAPSPHVAAAAAAALVRAGWRVLLTGSPAERGLVATVRDLAAVDQHDALVDVAGRTDLGGLAALLRSARAVVVGNTGPAHLAAAVGTPVVSWFSPVVPAERWAPWGVPAVLLGDQEAACALSRARECPVPGHPCLAVDASTVVEAVRSVVGAPDQAGVADARSSSSRSSEVLS